MPLNVRNLEQIKAKDVKLYEALQDIINGVNTHEQQGNFNATGQPLAPPPVTGVNVVGANGHLTVSITDANQNLFRGIQYFAEHASTAQFSDAQTVPMGTARNITIPVGNQTRYVRVYSSYSSSPPSSPLYHGGAQPIAVNGGGTDSGPQFLPSEGTGTGPARVGLQGPGQVPFRSKTGAPPVR